MRNLPCLLQISLMLLTLNYSGYGQTDTGPPPDWVNPTEFTELSLPDADQNDGLFYLLADQQLNFIENEFYSHYIYQVKTSEEVQLMSDISVDIDPEFQEIVFHKVNIIRDGEVYDQISSKKIQTIQREQNMDRFLYDGRITSLINLTDVRRGDFIEYSFTKSGSNPVFDGLSSSLIPLQYYVPISHSSYRILVGNNENIEFRFKNTEIEPEKTLLGEATEFSWNLSNVEPLDFDYLVPSWYSPGKQLHTTNSKSWSDINEWAERHFSPSESDLNYLERETRNKFTAQDTFELAREIINFVQDEIRYLGFEHGLNSHQPHSPREVLQRRFGDCKDKSVLLSSLLNINGIEAHPVLVNTTMGKVLPEFLPGIYAFDHSVVRYRIEGETFYIDPTLSSQGGWGYARFFPNYYYGLVIGEPDHRLSQLPLSKNSRTSEEIKFSMWEIGGSARMEVTTVYSGLAADQIRSYLNQTRQSEVQREYLEYYSYLYPDIDFRTVMRITDIRDRNILTIYEDYVIFDFWDKENDDELLKAAFYPLTLAHYVEPAQSGIRRATPYALEFPVDFQHTTEIHLPETWSVDQEEFEIISPHYEMNHSLSYKDGAIEIVHNYATLSDYIPAEDFPAYIRDHRKMKDNLHLVLTHQTFSSGSGILPNLFNLALILMGVFLGGFISYKLYRFDPKPKYDGKYGVRDFSGMQIFAVTLLILWTSYHLYYALVEKFFKDIPWLNLALSDGLFMVPFLAFALLYEFILLFFMGTTIVLFFNKRSSVPQLMSIFFGVILFYQSVFWVLEAEILHGIGHNPNFLTTILPPLLMAIVFIPYFYFSEEVSDTFTRRYQRKVV